MTAFPFHHARGRLLASIAALGLMPLVSGCSAVVLSPSGDVAQQQRDLIIIATVLMLIIIVPVMVLTVLFARKYRAGSEASEAEYDPDWDHSTGLELLIWSAPLLIIICLGAVTWTSTHRLDPYRPIERLQPGRQIDKNVKPLDVQVVSLDWKWLFIYPEYGIATINEVAAPVDRPITFHLTSSSVMNAFYVPALAGMIYTMPSMETKLNAVINKPGDYEGFSANFSGDGFADMDFRFHGLTDADFDKWIATARQSGRKLDEAGYMKLAQPSEDEPVTLYSGVAPQLYDKVMNHCVAPGSICMRDMMAADAATAAGGEENGGATNMRGMNMQRPAEGPKANPAANATALLPLRGAGLVPPGRKQAPTMTAEASSSTPVADKL
ncbi:ubiquinol oxidase subunit II [Stakelama sp. CBK3Z-3]|uniref:Ubiquinol oxidase polypeptide II n=1 Tax=Stakelama flava TaxID=2860338 RepID=A0ABS6XPA3_9SPHN|nr:ubiquinol oxidase subunit II [Stakelama flava]MBW4331603.1 ubiquinol oxidase subunit II [Stakelama flava]